MSDEVSVFSKIKEIVLDVNPQDVLNDARDCGLEVFSAKDLVEQPHNYVFIEKLATKYASLTASYCAASGATSGFGGVATTIALGGVDIANMAAQLYRLNQKIAILNGFDIENAIHKEKAQLIYLKALGFDAAAQAAIRTQMTKAAAENLAKRGPSANVAIRLIMEVAKLLGIKLTKNQAAKFVPVLGGVLGGGLNYMFAKNAAEKMISEYKSDYFDRWQVRAH
ncbi:EcsC family protein [Pseudogulbenkiania ferrooxidans]|uniref:EcsC family protein n=1 Tax=Pseudogulbenkiania ferrooxidans 2002 TaxID=279714 RepID=B9Z2G1_9NEIS|nr:EcsC family protein [Pseudogulbenkiania ferrooxidans]EEG08764.1 hypothetical protein FuraDRAFT_1524 [Pseudogulbenkiania ferrooxidans 2002]